MGLPPGALLPRATSPERDRMDITLVLASHLIAFFAGYALRASLSRSRRRPMVT